MIYSWRLFGHLLFLGGIFLVGCTSSHQNVKEYSGELNQFDSSGIKQGLWEGYADTVLISKGTYVNGEEEGLWTYWYEQGQMREEGHFNAGVKEGIWVEWFPDGTIMWKGEWKNGSRHIDGEGAQVQILFPGQDHPPHVLVRDSLYSLKIRIQNIPAENLFVEVNNGGISWDEETDLYKLNTSSDTMFTLAIGFMPDLEFPDFRNLVSEVDFKLR